MRKTIVFFLIITALVSVSYYAGRHRLLSCKCNESAAQEVVVEHNVTEHKPIVILIPSYNNAEYCKRNLESVFKQTYDNFRVIYIDDCSSDDTYERVKELIASHDCGKRFTLIHNETRLKGLENAYRAIHSCGDREIVAILDGDDELAHEKVLEKINAAYADPNVWMTYGQYITYPQYERGICCKVSKKTIKNHSFRKEKWSISHLRTFYAGLFKKINEGDLKQNGQFFEMTWDLAITFPLIEMASAHHQFIPDILYVYNYRNPISDHRVDHERQLDLENYIRALPPYPQLDSLFDKE